MADQGRTVADETQPPVLVVSLNWNGWRDTLSAVNSVLNLNYPNLGVLVIDNRLRFVGERQRERHEIWGAKI
jgi:hypothetical protein